MSLAPDPVDQDHERLRCEIKRWAAGAVSGRSSALRLVTAVALPVTPIGTDRRYPRLALLTCEFAALPPAAVELIRLMDRTFAEMSGGWTEEALRFDPRWAEVQDRAPARVRCMEWPEERGT